MDPTLFTSLFLLFAFTTTNLPLSFSSNNAQVVQYKDGGNVSLKGPNYILPAKIGLKGGGITLGRKTKNSTCPVAIIQENCAVVNGYPIKFSGQDNSESSMFIDTPLNIEFVDIPVDCAFPQEWVVIDDLPHQWLSISAYDYPSEKIIKGTFSIQRYQRGYKLVFCPKPTTSTNPSSSACKNIGIHKDKNGVRSLILTDKDPFEFVLMYGD
ncbi:hypothetical protein PIB30_002510 [Stylosanthes scabra]|uniref:Uncharacterized protein n=1 Tax=Stylosanthes scabra TaxID=79078 RepID=A0ABU6Y2I0_9FABA|nr:hypothetical protein [Stylosanthes scabra]